MVSIIRSWWLMFFVGSLKGNGDIICPRGITSFSKAPYSDSYYICIAENQTPILKICPEGEYYWAAKNACSTKQTTTNTQPAPDLKIHARPVLGDNVYLGDFYDSNADEVLTGYSLWKSETISKYKRHTISQTWSADVFATTSTFDRLERAGFAPSVALDVLGDVTELEGSSKYLKDYLSSENEVAVILAYSSTTATETLPVYTPGDFDYCDKTVATHVISKVTYGAHVNFVFKMAVEERKNKNEVTNLLRAAVQAIKEGRSDIDESVRKILKEIRVDLFSDFLTGSVGNYEESAKLYKTLPSRIGMKNDTVSTKMVLLPITKFCNGKKIRHVAISSEVMGQINQMLAEIESSKLTVTTLQKMQSSGKYTPLRDLLRMLLREIKTFQFRLKDDIQEVVPRVRRGNGSEEELISLLNKYAKSPFNQRSIERFLRNRRRELQTMDFVINKNRLSGTNVRVCTYEEGIDAKTMFEKPFTLMLKFNILPSDNLLQKFLANDPVDEVNFWYNNVLIISAMGRAFSKFVQFASTNMKSETHGFLLAISDIKQSATDDVLSDTIEILGQKEGLVYGFEFPLVPPMLKKISNTYNSITFAVSRPQNTWVTAFSISHWIHNTKAVAVTQNFRFSSNNFTDVKVEGLKANILYNFVLQYTTPMGSSPSSDVSSYFTRPCNPPSALRINNLTSDSVRVSWDAPSVCGKGVEIHKYRVTTIGKESHSTIVDHSRTIEIQHLQPATMVTVTVEGMTETHNYNTSNAITLTTLPATTSFITKPDAPSHLSLINISTHSATVEWFPPKHVASGGVIDKYVVKYGVVNHMGDVSFKGMEMIKTSDNTSCQLQDLIQGTTYAVSVKVVTSKGESDFSSKLLATTRFVKSDLDLLNDSLTQKMNQSIHHIESSMEEQKKEVDHHFGIHDYFINGVSNSHSMMVYYPRLRSEQLDIDRVTGCGGTINTAGDPNGFAYPYGGGYRLYSWHEGCTWRVNTGLVTKLESAQWYMDSNSYVYIYDEYKLLKKTNGYFGTVELKSGDGYVMFKSGDNEHDQHWGFRIKITVTSTKRIAAHKYYPKQQAQFTGYGAPVKYTEHHTINLQKSNISIPVCVQDCRERFMQDNKWSSLAVELDADPIQCTCYKDPQGFQYTLSKFQYQFA